MIKEARAWLKNVGMGKYNDFIIIFLAMVYVTIKLTCNLMYLRLVEVSIIFPPHDMIIPASTFLFPLVYVLAICIMMLSNKRIALIVALIGILCDGFFSFGSGSIIRLPIPYSMTPSELKNTLSINLIGNYMWSFYMKGIIVSIVTSILSLEIFIFLNKIKVGLFINMLISTFFATIIHHMQMVPYINWGYMFYILKEYSLLYLSVLILYIMIAITVRQIAAKSWEMGN